MTKDDSGPNKSCPVDANGNVTDKGDYCSSPPGPATSTCADSFWLAATFAASAVNINDTAPACRTALGDAGAPVDSGPVADSATPVDSGAPVDLGCAGRFRRRLKTRARAPGRVLPRWAGCERL